MPIGNYSGQQVKAKSTSVTPDSSGTWSSSGLAKEAGGNLAAAVAGIGATTDAKVDTDAVGSLSAKLRGLVSLIIAMSAKLPASLGIKAASASLSTAQCTEDAAKQTTISANTTSIAAEVVRLDLTSAPTPVSIDTSTASTTGLTVGTTYAIWASAPCFIKVGGDAVTAALTDVPLGVGIEAALLWTPSADDTDDGVAVIASVAGGTLYVQPCVA